MTWAFEEANSKLLDDVVSVADVEAKACVDGSLVKFLQLKFCGVRCVLGNVKGLYNSKERL